MQFLSTKSIFSKFDEKSHNLSVDSLFGIMNATNSQKRQFYNLFQLEAFLKDQIIQLEGHTPINIYIQLFGQIDLLQRGESKTD